MTDKTIHTFRLLLSGPTDDATADTLMDACGDMLLGTQGGRLSADFDRAAGTFEEAVLSAIRDVEIAHSQVSVDRVEPDDLVTATIIAERTGRTRQSVALLIAGERGPGRFPEPLSFVDAKTRLWRWADVADWFEDAGEVVRLGSARDARERRFLAALNGALEARLNLRAYRDGGGDDRTAAAVRRIAAGAMPSQTDEAIAGPAYHDVTLRTGLELLDVATRVLPGSDASDNAGVQEHCVPAWMRASTIGFSRALRLHFAGSFVDASPFEELVAEGMTYAAFARINRQQDKPCLFCETTDEPPPHSLMPWSDRHRVRGIFAPQLGAPNNYGLELHAMLVDGLEATERAAKKITVWITHTHQDHISGLASLLQPPPAGHGIVTFDWDELLGELLAESAARNAPHDPSAEPDPHRWLASGDEWGRQAPTPVGILTARQRLWATTWSFGQTLRLYTEHACPPEVQAVKSALDALERLP